MQLLLAYTKRGVWKAGRVAGTEGAGNASACERVPFGRWGAGRRYGRCPPHSRGWDVAGRPAPDARPPPLPPSLARRRGPAAASCRLGEHPAPFPSFALPCPPPPSSPAPLRPSPQRLPSQSWPFPLRPPPPPVVATRTQMPLPAGNVLRGACFHPLRPPGRKRTTVPSVHTLMVERFTLPRSNAGGGAYSRPCINVAASPNTSPATPRQRWRLLGWRRRRWRQRRMRRRPQRRQRWEEHPPGPPQPWRHRLAVAIRPLRARPPLSPSPRHAHPPRPRTISHSGLWYFPRGQRRASAAAVGAQR